MIETIKVAVRDVCGAMEKAHEASTPYNEKVYDIPDGWRHGSNASICICPECVCRLGIAGKNPSRDADKHSAVNWGE